MLIVATKIKRIKAISADDRLRVGYRFVRVYSMIGWCWLMCWEWGGVECR